MRFTIFLRTTTTQLASSAGFARSSMDPYGDLFHSNKRDLPSLPDELNFDDDFLSNPLGGGVDLGAPSPASGGTSSNVGTPGSSAAQFSISTSTSASTGVGHGTYSSAPSPSAASHTSAPSAGLSLFSPTFTQSFTFPPTQQPLNNNNSSSNHAGAFATGSGVLGPASAAPTSGGQAGGVIGAVSGQLVDQHPVNFLEYRERNIHAAESAYTASSYSEQPGGGDYNDYEHQPALLHQTDDSPLPKPVAIQAFQHQSSASPVGGANQHGTMHTSAGFIAPAQTTMQAGTTPSANGALDAFESADLFDLPQTFGNMMNEGRPRQMRHVSFCRPWLVMTARETDTALCRAIRLLCTAHIRGTTAPRHCPCTTLQSRHGASARQSMRRRNRTTNSNSSDTLPANLGHWTSTSRCSRSSNSHTRSTSMYRQPHSGSRLRSTSLSLRSRRVLTRQLQAPQPMAACPT